MSRWENAPNLRTLIRLTGAMVDLWYTSPRRAPKAITLDIDDIADTVPSHQQLSLFNAHYDERCFLSIHVYDARPGHCVLTILRTGKTPDGREVSTHVRSQVRRIRLHWPNKGITIRGDSYYGRREAMACASRNVTALSSVCPPNAVLATLVFIKTDDVCVRRATGNFDVLHDYTETRYAPDRGRILAASWRRSRRRGNASIPAVALVQFSGLPICRSSGE